MCPTWPSSVHETPLGVPKASQIPVSTPGLFHALKICADPFQWKISSFPFRNQISCCLVGRLGKLSWTVVQTIGDRRADRRGPSCRPSGTVAQTVGDRRAGNRAFCRRSLVHSALWSSQCPAGAFEFPKTLEKLLEPQMGSRGTLEGRVGHNRALSGDVGPHGPSMESCDTPGNLGRSMELPSNLRDPHKRKNADFVFNCVSEACNLLYKNSSKRDVGPRRDPKGPHGAWCRPANACASLMGSC